MAGNLNSRIASGGRPMSSSSSSSSSGVGVGVTEFIRHQVPDWDDEVVARARFKTFSGQRSDWEPRYLFWKDLIFKIARHFGVFIIQASEVKNNWFNRGGLTPLCIEHVLLEMCNTGELLQSQDLVDPRAGRLSQLFKRVVNLMGVSNSSSAEKIEDRLILRTLLVERAAEVVKVLSESHWTSFCIITMGHFEKICNGSNEASVILSYLSGTGKAQLLSITKKDCIEGVKVSLVQASVPTITSVDYDVLHLIWTTEKLQQQLDVIDQRYEMSRNNALASIKSGNKPVALRHARKLKLTSESREKCTSMLNRVEEVLSVIANAESTKKVTEAIQIGARAIKESGIDVEEVQLCLEELDESIASQKEVDETLVSTPLQYADIEDEDVEEEFKKLELEFGGKIPHNQPSSTIADDSGKVQESQESIESIVKTSPNVEIADDKAGKVDGGETVESLSKNLSTLRLEAA